MLDAFCGTGGISDGAAAEGWEVIGIDVAHDARYRHPIIHKDIREVSPAEVGLVDWFHASPPCQRFSYARASRKHDPATDGDLFLLHSALWLRDQLKPKVWSVENVLGAIPLFSKVLGPPRLRNGSFFLWGNFPGFLMDTSQPQPERSAADNLGRHRRLGHLPPFGYHAGQGAGNLGAGTCSSVCAVLEVPAMTELVAADNRPTGKKGVQWRPAWAFQRRRFRRTD